MPPAATTVTGRQRRRLVVGGIVQGVGFRPFLHRLARQLGVGGRVVNDGQGVVVEIEGEPAALDAFTAALATEAPPLAVVERVVSEAAAPTGETAFVIADSAVGGDHVALVSPDVATCDDCLRELADETDRRYRHPFVNCTNCGPRFTVVVGVPYDRPRTTMARFPMCDDCRSEYDDPDDRRFHAQPVCCPRCGPRLRLLDRDGSPVEGRDADPIATAAALLRAGGVLAVKGLGGYHLATPAHDVTAVGALRSRKHREEKPFAVMVPDVAAAERLCVLEPLERAALVSTPRPIVLVRRRPGAEVASAVAPGVGTLGVMLPYTPVHHLLLAEVGAPLVMTSGNVSDEPIAYDDADAMARLAGIADAFLVHDRPIRTRTDDSVVRVLGGRAVPIRRSRGLVPRPVSLPWPAPRPVLACGAELKHTFCVARGDHAFISHHVGDLENHETYEAFADGVDHFCRLFDVEPAVVAHDLHPEYLSGKYAAEYATDHDGVELVGVQHHHAHVAACMAEHGVSGPVVGVAFDGLGFGTDGTIWGGEFLVADLTGFRRAAHLETVPMPGGTAAIREPWRMAAAWLDRVGLADAEAGVAAGGAGGAAAGAGAVRRRHADRWDVLLDAARKGLNAPVTSSVGRLFDAVAALAGVRDAVSYEGQAAVEFEQLADLSERGAYPVGWSDGDPLVLSGSDLVAAAAEDLAQGVAVPVVSARFHRGLARGVVEVCRRVCEAAGVATVALSGGVFQNALLVDATVEGLEGEDLTVLTHGVAPPNDGGISLGQAAVAAARDRASGSVGAGDGEAR